MAMKNRLFVLVVQCPRVFPMPNLPTNSCYSVSSTPVSLRKHLHVYVDSRTFVYISFGNGIVKNKDLMVNCKLSRINSHEIMTWDLWDPPHIQGSPALLISFLFFQYQGSLCVPSRSYDSTMSLQLHQRAASTCNVGVNMTSTEVMVLVSFRPCLLCKSCSDFLVISNGGTLIPTISAGCRCTRRECSE